MGLLSFLGSVVGIVRFPDFYTRMHAAGKGDSLSSFLIVLGFAVHEVQDFSMASALVALKIVSIGLFIMLTSPTSTHVLMEAGYDDRIVQPWRKGAEGGRRSLIMIWQFDIIILVFLVVTALIALHVRDLLAASMILGIYSFLICLLWAEMGAVDGRLYGGRGGGGRERGLHDRNGFLHGEEE